MSPSIKLIFALRLEELLQQKEKVIVELNRRESRFESDFRAARAKLDNEHAFRIAELESHINAITTEAQSDKMVGTNHHHVERIKHLNKNLCN